MFFSFQHCLINFVADVFDNKSKGLFAFLDQENNLKKPSEENFTDNFLSAWTSSRTKKRNEFIIHHFSGVVTYSTVSDDALVVFSKVI